MRFAAGNRAQVHTDNELSLTVRKLSVWTPEERSWKRSVVKPKTIVLNEVTANIKRGEFIAVLGPSGAGKTTFLSCLAGKCAFPGRGRVAVNGTLLRDLNGVAEMVPQFDVFMNELTVMEHLQFMTEMKLGSVNNINNRMLLTTLIKQLKLEAHVRTQISALSGGEKRLLSLASTLLSNPQIIICDEPTTGLDSYSASLVVAILKQLAASGKIVICSVHQPSSDLFKEFNNIMLMAEGKLIFHGTQDDCRAVFENTDLRCPNNYNQAEFYIRTVSGHFDASNKVERISEIYNNRFLNSEEPRSAEPPRSAISRRNWFIQIFWLIRRSYWSFKRGYGSHLFQTVLNIVVSSVVLFACYVGITGTTQTGIQDLRGFLWLLCSEVCYSLSYSALYAFESDLTLFKREVGIYSSSAFFTSRFLAYIPRCIIWPILYVLIAGFAVDLPNRIVTSTELSVALIGGAIAATAYGLGMSALFTSTGIMGDVMPCADLPLALMSGAFLRITTLPYWLLPLKYLSHFYFTMDAVSNIYWRQIAHIECPPNSSSSCVSDGLSVLRESGYNEDFILVDSLGLLEVTILWCLVGYYGLRREEKKGYVY